MHVSSTVNQYCIALPKLTDTVLVRNRNSVAFANRRSMKKNMLTESTTATPRVTPNSTYMFSVISCVTASTTERQPMNVPIMNMLPCFVSRSMSSLLTASLTSGSNPKNDVNTACNENGSAHQNMTL